MKKRLRKKLHQGEFQEFGFCIAWEFAHPLDARSNVLFFDEFLEMVSASGLNFGGGGVPGQGSGFVCKTGRGTASEEDRSLVAGWFKSLGALVSATVGPLEDAWHNSPPQVTSVKDWIAREGEVIVMPPMSE